MLGHAQQMNAVTAAELAIEIGEHIQLAAARARTSCKLDLSFSSSASFGRDRDDRHFGVDGGASGPCFSSPAGYASA